VFGEAYVVIGEGLCMYALVQVAYESEWGMKGLDRTHRPIMKTNLLPVYSKYWSYDIAFIWWTTARRGGWWAKKGTRG